MFGHTFIKVDTATIPYAINYSALVRDDIGPFEYAYDGNFGKFQSHYKMLTFNLKDSEYRDDEFRDLINIELDFNEDEVQNLILHMYEIKDTDENYFFMTRNCSSEILKLLDMAKYDSNFSDELETVTLPIDIVYILKNNSLTKDTTKTLSKLKLFNLHVEQLTQDERVVLQKILEQKITISDFAKLQTLSDKSKSLIISSAIAYIEMKLVQQKLHRKYTSSLLHLIELQREYEDLSKEEVVELEDFPVSNKYNRVSIGSRSVEDQKTEINLGYRLWYRDRFDLVDDEVKNGSVELLDFSLKFVDDDVSLNHLTFINLESMPISNEYFSEHTTKLKVAMERLFYDEDLYTFAKYGRGYRYRIDKNFTYNFALSGGVYYHDEDVYAISPDISLEYNLANSFVSVLKYEYAKYSNSIDVNNIYLDNYYKVNDYSTMKVEFSYKDDVKSYSEMRLSYSIHF